MRTIAHLCFGVCLDGNAASELPWDEYNTHVGSYRPTFQNWLAQLAGLSDPANPHYGVDFGQWSAQPQNKVEMKRYNEAAKAAVEVCPIVPIMPDASDGKVVVAVRGSTTQAEWSDVVAPVVAIDTEALRKAEEFCARHSIPFQEPRWLLVTESDYGI
jgi:hypothetical protein